MNLKKPRAVDSDTEQLSTPALLDEHERVFGPLTPQARRRIERAAESDVPRSWEGMDGLAA